MLEIATRSDIDLAAYRRVAWDGEPLRLADSAADTMRRSRAAFVDFLHEHPDVVVYGVTTGAGDRSKQRLAFDADEASLVPPLRGGPAWGPPLPDRVVRGIVVARLANWVDGYAAVRPELADAVVKVLDEPLPSVPATGHGGSGEIVALSHLFGPLAQRFPFRAKEPVSLINGAPCAAALAADATLAAERRIALAVMVLSLAIEAAEAPLGAYAPVLGALHGDPHESEVLRLLATLLHPTAPRDATQAPVSFRVIPRVLAHGFAAVSRARATATTALSAVTENPVFLVDGVGSVGGAADDASGAGRVLSNGGFHDSAVPPMLGELTALWADVVSLCVALGKQLLTRSEREGDGDRPSNLLMPLLALVDDARSDAQPSLLAATGTGQNDLYSPTFAAWRRQDALAAMADDALAQLAVLASYRLSQLPSVLLTGPLGELLGEVRERFPVEGDRWDRGSDSESLSRWMAAVNHASDSLWAAFGPA